MKIRSLARLNERQLCQRRKMLLEALEKKRTRLAVLLAENAPAAMLNRMERDMERDIGELEAIELLVGDMLDQRMKERQNSGTYYGG